MKYFIDLEFIEGFHKPLFGKRRHFIDLISIGIVAEDGREYYAVSNDFNERDADQWVKDNVIHPIFKEACDYPDGLLGFEKKFIKSNKQIAQDIFEFCANDPLTLKKAKDYNVSYESLGIEFYSYYADYDWVLFCSLFGRMIDLPNGFPMYCRDLKQMLDDKAKARIKDFCFGDTEEEINAMADRSVKGQIEAFKTFSGYPKQINEHNALDDARWNYELYKFLTSLK